MANNNILLLLIVAVVAFLLYYYVFDKQLGGACKWCPKCGQKTDTNGKCPTCPDCPNCLVTRQDALKALQQMARGCTHRLRGVVREDMATSADVSAFMSAGSNRLTIVTNVDPEDFVNLVQSGQQGLKQLKAVAISSAVVKGKKTYIVMSVSDGKLAPVGAPTTSFMNAFKYFESTTRKEVGPDTNNLVFYIDEDVPCPEDEYAPMPTPIPLPSPSPHPKKESCCGGGRRF